MERAELDSGVTLAELLAAFSLATDLGLGQPLEHVLRSWQIAAQIAYHNLGISRKTAGTHIERIYTKTGASSRSTATLFALRNGLLDPLDL